MSQSEAIKGVFIWQPHPDQEEEFIRRWKLDSEVIQTYPGAKGTLLHRSIEDPTIFIGYASWESLNARQHAMEQKAIEHPELDTPELNTEAVSNLIFSGLFHDPEIVVNAKKPSRRRPNPSSIKRGDTPAYEREIVQIISQTKDGPYLDIDRLKDIVSNVRLPAALREYARRAIKDIQEHGENSIYHLCMRPRLSNEIRRHNIRSIDALKGLLATGQKLTSIAKVGQSEVEDAIQAFDLKKQEQEINQTT